MRIVVVGRAENLDPCGVSAHGLDPGRGRTDRALDAGSDREDRPSDVCCVGDAR